MKTNRMLGSVAAALLLFVAASARAQSTAATVDPAVAAQQEALSTVQATRAAVISEIVDRWRSNFPPAVRAQNIGDGAAEAAARLQSASPELLLAASRAQSFDELTGLLRSGQPTVMPLEPGQPIPNALGSTTGDLVFTPVTPCRIIDTRSASGGLAGRLIAGTGKWFSVNLANYAAQGGNAAGCGLPALPFRPGAVAINVTSTDQTGVGNIRAVQSGGGTPLVSLLNYTPGVNLANAAIVSSAVSGSDDIYILSSNSDTHVIVDIMGYFAAPVATALSCTTVNAASGAIPTATGSFITATCAAGYTVTGGGFWVGSNFTPTVYTFGSMPSGNGWQAGIYNTQPGTVTLTTYAVCCRIPGR